MVTWFAESGFGSSCWIWLLVVLGLAVVFAKCSYWFCWIWLFILLDLSAGFCWILILALVGFGS